MVRDGYKQTEIGVIPEGWEVKTIGDIGSVSSGGTPSRTNNLYWNGSIPWVTTTQIDFNVINDADQFITQIGLNNSAAKLFPPGTLLMAMYGQGKTRGKVAILGVESSTNQACAAILLNQEVEINYIFHYLVAQYEAIRNLSNTGNQENLNGLIIKSIKIATPPKEEQQAIAQALSDVDALITSLDKLITKKRAIKTATMQQLLTGKKRLPGFGEGKGYKQTEIGVLPEDWGIVLLDSVAKRGSGHTPDKKYPEYWNGTIKWISLKDSDCLDTLYIHDTADKTTPLGIANSSAVIHPTGTVVLSRDAGVGKSAIMSDEMAVSQHFIAWQCSTKLNNHLLYYWLQLKKSEFERIAIGNTIKTIGLPYFQQLKIPLPSINEQRIIATVLSDMDAEIAALENRLAKTQAIKQGMMQELLTGRTRLV